MSLLVSVLMCKDPAGVVQPTLTLRAVVSSPANQTDAAALLVAGVVSKRVISGPAVVSTAVSKVVFVT